MEHRSLAISGVEIKKHRRVRGSVLGEAARRTARPGRPCASWPSRHAPPRAHRTCVPGANRPCVPRGRVPRAQRPCVPRARPKSATAMRPKSASQERNGHASHERLAHAPRNASAVLPRTPGHASCGRGSYHDGFPRRAAPRRRCTRAAAVETRIATGIEPACQRRHELEGVLPRLASARRGHRDPGRARRPRCAVPRGTPHTQRPTRATRGGTRCGKQAGDEAERCPDSAVGEGPAISFWTFS